MPDHPGARLDADAVINGFADIGCVCAVLNPGTSDEFRERTLKAARRADIVILDWKIHDSPGDQALDVMRAILREDQQRLRLIAIYTGEPDLHGIFKHLRKLVTEVYGDEGIVAADSLQISNGPLHVVVLAKDGTFNDRLPELQNQEVQEHFLADRLVREFAVMAGGLIRNTAIAGIASIRDSTHKIISKFDQSLDPAYLGHRLLLSHPPDAEDHLVATLGAEVVSVLEEGRPGERAGVDAIESWLDLRVSEGLDLNDPFPFSGAPSPVICWRDLLLNGLEASGERRPDNSGSNRLQRMATQVFSQDSDGAVRSNRRFGALLNLKTRYPGRAPRLSIGTILSTQEEDADRFLLCLQPKCDSVRHGASAGFPFIPLIPLSDVEVNHKGMSLRLVVETQREQWKSLGIVPKPSELTVRSFGPGPNPPGIVVALEEETGKFYFKDVQGHRYQWIAEMKDEHALGIASEVSSALARPGPNDAEWIRRASGSVR